MEFFQCGDLGPGCPIIFSASNLYILMLKLIDICRYNKVRILPADPLPKPSSRSLYENTPVSWRFFPRLTYRRFPGVYGCGRGLSDRRGFGNEREESCERERAAGVTCPEFEYVFNGI